MVKQTYKTFDERFYNFKKRIPKRRLGNKIDTTHLRWIDTASKEEVVQEYNLIKEKKSTLNSRQRTIIVDLYEGDNGGRV